MKRTMMIASIAVVASGAIAACSSNKPAEDATSQNGPVAATTGPTDLYQPNGASTVAPTSGGPVDGTPTTPTTSRTEAAPADVSGPNGPAPNMRSSNAASTTTAPHGSMTPSTSTAPSTVGTPAPPQPAASSEPDNTRVNKRDRAPNAPTPMDQGNNASDLKITQQIRQAVMADGSLSFTAKNVKIITANGKVTLRGPVNTDQERQSIATSARKIAGDANVDDQIEVKR